MASEKITKFIDDIKTLSVLELSELIDAIQEEFGVTAVMAAAPAAGAGAAAAEERPNLTLYWLPLVTLRWLLSRLLRTFWVWV